MTDRPASTWLLRGSPQYCRPAERFLLTATDFAALPEALALEPSLVLLSLFADTAQVHAAFLDADHRLLLASCPIAQGRYPALSPARPGAVRFERMIHDLWGHVAEGALDLRPWLDHGRWPLIAPLATRPGLRSDPPDQPVFLPIEGEGWHQVPIGPVHGGEPGHFRLSVQGELVVRLEQRLGYAHKGTIGLMLGKSPRTAARFAARIAGDSTVAHSLAFAQAAEAATASPPPPRAEWLRAVMLEVERVANHLGDWGAVCKEAGFAWPHASCGVLREGVLRAAHAAFGHRRMMDRVIPGGLAVDLADGGADAILAALAAVEQEMPALQAITDDHASLQDRLVGTGVLRPELAEAFAAGGPVGRASGRSFDARRTFPTAPYQAAPPTVAVFSAGDVDARLRVRAAEIEDSIRLVRALLDRLPPGEIYAPLTARGGEGIAVVEGFRGEVVTWLALDDGGLIRAAFPRDPSWLQWPLLEAAMEGTILADFSLCSRSFNCSASGVDL